MYDRKYGDFEELRNILLNRRIKAWNEDELVLDDDTQLTIEMSECDCCASAGGKFKDVELDAVITAVDRIDEGHRVYNGDGHTSKVRIVLFHNRNIIAQAACYANDGNGGYYYSVCSIVVKGIHYQVCDA